MNGCEPQPLRMLYLANRASMDWTLGSPCAIDLVVSDAEQLSDSVVPLSINKDVRKQMRRQCFMRGKARSKSPATSRVEWRLPGRACGCTSPTPKPTLGTRS